MVVTAVLVIPPAPESEPLSVNLPTETVTPQGMFKVPFTVTLPLFICSPPA